MPKILSLPAGAVTSTDIVREGVLNPKYVMTGNYENQTGYVLVKRIDPDNGIRILNLDVTDMSYITVDFQNVQATFETQIYFNGSMVYQSPTGTTRRQYVIDARNTTGVVPLNIILTGNNCQTKLYNILVS